MFSAIIEVAIEVPRVGADRFGMTSKLRQLDPVYHEKLYNQAMSMMI
jgi:hypothetical protein